jgi:hypothetical protein
MTRTGMLVVAVVVVSACGVGADQDRSASINSELNFKPGFFNPPPRDCHIVSARPMVMGTVRSAPSIGMLEVAPVGESVQSMFFETANLGAETRRGVVEFEVPHVDGRMTRAELKFDDVHGYLFQPMSDDFHSLTVYTGADGVITPDDFMREGTPFATFATNLNTLHPVTRDFDVAGQFNLGDRVGFRLELQRTPTQAGSFGSGFDGFRLDLTVCNSAALAGGALADPSGVR